MNITTALKDTEQRYRDRAPIRTYNCDKLKAGLPLQADTPERVEKRLQRLGFDASTAKLLIGSSLPTIPSAVSANPTDAPVTLERILHTANDLMNINFLDRGSVVANSVGRIRVRLADGTQGYGTGFLVSPRLLLTNHHVLPDAQSASLSRVEFDYEDSADGNPKQAIAFDFDPDTLYFTDEYLDYSLVAVQPKSRSGIELKSFGWLPLIAAEGKVIVGESVSIIQHPNGEPKQVALRENKVVDALPDFLHYETDTAPGSSGSPVFNDQWEVVALHHSGVPKKDSNGRILNLMGAPWTPNQGEQQVDWIANEGVRISRVIAHIQGQAVSAQAQSLITEMLGRQTIVADTNQPASSTPSSKSNSSNNGIPEAAIEGRSLPHLSTTDENNIVTWTIPLQVSVRVGQFINANHFASTSQPSSSNQLLESENFNSKFKA